MAFAAALISGCGGAVSSGTLPVQSGSTSVTIFATSTANDQLSEFNISVDSLTLTTSSGKAVTVLATPQNAEYIHLNGHPEPLTTVSIPQGVYTSAAASVENAGFECITLDSSGALVTHGFNYANTSASVTVNLPSPISISGAAMGLSLDLLVSQSASWTTCDSTGDPYSITPTFDLRPVTLSSTPADNQDGTATGLRGLIASVDPVAGRLTVTAADDGPSWTVVSDDGTEYQGVTGLSALEAGMPVDMDVALQANGSLLATRVAVPDTNTANLSVSSGPVQFVSIAWPALFADEVEEQGYLPGVFGSAPFSFGGAVFQTSGQFTNLQNLPFAASFNATNIVAGQSVSITTHATSLSPAPTYVPAATMTLLPQTINGTVSAIGGEASFTTYTIQLASYDLFPELAVQGGQTTLLTTPNTVVVYADDNTQMLNTNSISVGSVMRFYGLVFNDNGTLRMDCAQINDGVPG